MVVLVTCNNKVEPINKELEWSQDFPYYNPMGDNMLPFVRFDP